MKFTKGYLPWNKSKAIVKPQVSDNLRICTHCLLPKEESEFDFNGSGQRRNTCRKCRNATRRHRHATSPVAKQKTKATKKRSHDRNYGFIRDYLSTHPCLDCGESRWQVLEFDHINDKIMNVCDIAKRGYALKRVIDEIEKCEVRCANCHRLKTYERGSHWRNRK